MNHNLAIDWAECALMHRLVPFTLEDFALLVANAESRRYSRRTATTSTCSPATWAPPTS